MAAFLPLLLRLLPWLLGAAIVIGGWLWVDRVCWSSACVTKTHQLRELEAQLEHARERATALALKWSEAINKVEVRYVERQQETRAVSGQIRQRIESHQAAGGSVGGLRLDANALRLHRDIADFANDSAPAEVDQRSAEAVPEAPRVTTLAEWQGFALKAAEAYRDAYEKWRAAVAAYESITQRTE